MMSSKRPAPQDGSSAQRESKKGYFEQCGIGSVSSQEELDMKVLQFQNRCLAERLEQRQKQEGELRRRVAQLEKQRASDETVVCVVNRYWNQLDEDLRILIQRFDGETLNECENGNKNETSFLVQWDSEELKEKLTRRIRVSTGAMTKVLQIFDHIVKRNHKITQDLKEKSRVDGVLNGDAAVSHADNELQKENKNLHLLVTGLQEKHRQMSLKYCELQDKLAAMEVTNAELKNRIGDLEYDLTKTKQRKGKLDMRLSQALQRLQSCNSTEEGRPPVGAATQAKIEEMLEEQKELANNRLMELETLNTEHKDTLKLIEKLKMDMKSLPESVVVETAEYKCLQSQFSVLFNENVQLRILSEEAQNLVATCKSSHLRQIELMESEELAMQKKFRSEVIQLEGSLAQVRKEYEILRIQFEQNIAANEQTEPIDRELRQLLTSLQNHSQQFKGEAQRYRRKFKEVNAKFIKLQQSVSSLYGPSNVKEETFSATLGSSSCPPSYEEITIKKEKLDDHYKQNYCGRQDKGKSDAEIIRDLKQQLKKSHEAQKEVKLLLDMYKDSLKEQRDKAQEEDALLNDMEVTGQAFEDMQEQNLRLIQQLKEKDDANFKLVSDRIKSNQIYNMLREEKDALAEQVSTLQKQVEAQNNIVRKLEEKEQLLQSNVAVIEKELNLRRQFAEMQKKRCIESAQSVADMKLHLEKYLVQLKEAHTVIAEKTSSLQQEMFNSKRLHEEINSLRRKVEQSKKPELSATAEEVLMEEIREFKEQLTCPSCKVKRKDAVLSKCYHVFCFDCLKIRYETRQRKCPKCNGNFGANDFHRLYLT